MNFDWGEFRLAANPMREAGFDRHIHRGKNSGKPFFTGCVTACKIT
jgi:hypothetical protein